MPLPYFKSQFLDHHLLLHSDFKKWGFPQMEKGSLPRLRILCDFRHSRSGRRACQTAKIRPMRGYTRRGDQLYHRVKKSLSNQKIRTFRACQIYLTLTIPKMEFFGIVQSTICITQWLQGIQRLTQRTKYNRWINILYVYTANCILMQRDSDISKTNQSSTFHHFHLYFKCMPDHTKRPSRVEYFGFKA